MSLADPIRVDFVCVENAGRSQMAAAFAEREVDRRGLGDTVEVHSGGTDPADEVHEATVEVMLDAGMDVSGRTPTYVVLDELEESDILVTMGCTISKFNPDQYGVETRAWDFENPKDADFETAREIRDDIEARVGTLFDNVETLAAERAEQEPSRQGLAASLRRALPF